MLDGISTDLAAIRGVENSNNAPKDLVVVTDASAQPGDVDGIIAAAELNNSRVSVLLAGDCGLPGPTGASISRVSGQYLSSQVVLKRIADETRGKFFYIPGGSFTDFKYAPSQIFASIQNPVPPDTEPPVVSLSVTPRAPGRPTTRWCRSRPR